MNTNSPIIEYLALASGLFLAELLYFKIADKYNIIDKPNERSSHTDLTIRGGGIIFYLSLLFYFVVSGYSLPFFFMATTLLAGVSFFDDVKSVSNRVRIIIHFVSVMLLFYQLQLLTYPVWIVLIIFILITGIINAYNFMDGINGITGGYTLINLITLLFINHQTPFIEQRLILYIGIAVLVFIFFNFRTKAKCFAGDVGSVTLAFVLVFMIVRLILVSGEIIFVLLLTVYGIDSVMTIIHRLWKKENIFKAHRSHLYQIMTSKGGFSHISVSIFYMLTQALINIVVLVLLATTITFQIAVACFALGILIAFYWYYKLILLKN